MNSNAVDATLIRARGAAARFPSPRQGKPPAPGAERAGLRPAGAAGGRSQRSMVEIVTNSRVTMATSSPGFRVFTKSFTAWSVTVT